MTIDDLRRCFPATFAEPPQPLMRFIDRAIAKRCPDVDRTLLGEILGTYTSTPAYLRACTLGAARLDLDGQRKGYVTGHEACFAAYRLEHGGDLPDHRLANRWRKQSRRDARAAKRAAEQDTKPKRVSLADLRAAAKARRTS